MIDPFADNDKAQNAPTPSPWEDNAVTIDQTPVDANYVTVILKGGAGYGAPSISIRGGNISDALHHMKENESDLQELVRQAAKYGKAFGQLVDGDVPAANRSGNGGGQRPAGKPAGATEAPDGEKLFCDHGQRIYKSGVSKNGKPWGAFDCSKKICDREWKN